MCDLFALNNMIDKQRKVAEKENTKKQSPCAIPWLLSSFTTPIAKVLLKDLKYLIYKTPRNNVFSAVRNIYEMA